MDQFLSHHIMGGRILRVQFFPMGEGIYTHLKIEESWRLMGGGRRGKEIDELRERVIGEAGGGGPYVTTRGGREKVTIE